MADSLTTIDEASTREETPAQVCSVCGRTAPGQLISVSALPEDLQTIVRSNAGPADELCVRCVDLFSRAKLQLHSQAAVFEQNDFVLPTPLRMDADERFTGKGVTIAFLDSGFYAHPDLKTPRDRIVGYHSIFAADGDQTSLETNDVANWHGMMTYV